VVKRVCLVSSGTGGHLMPAMALARALERAGHETVLLTEGRAVEQEMLERTGCDAAATLPTGMLRAALSARRLFRQRYVDLVVGCGGRTSVPAALAARSLKLPLCLLEQNAVTGRANRLLMRWAERIYLGLPPARGHTAALRRHCLLTGTPLREGLGDLSKRAARHLLCLDPNIPVVLITGGSQGAEFLNRVVPAAICRLPGKHVHIQVLHLSGPDRDAEVRRLYNEESDVHAWVRPMAMDMGTLYAAADLVICRGGGGTVAELMAVGRPSIIVPYPHHRDRQQWHNGHVLEAAGAALVRDEKSLSPETLKQLIEDLLESPQRLQDMGRRTRHLAAPDPCGRILEDLTDLGALD
jgi:UDP-N-acetylglucosamine--N-acetylmuramyl-(pentapeptide) pyrophosphoryl-undecaprenol N-acetylglucosamine transferase